MKQTAVKSYLIVLLGFLATSIGDGFTVTGWYKKGATNNQSNTKTNDTIAAGTITYHPVHICSNNLDNDEIEFIQDNQFNVSSMHINE